VSHRRSSAHRTRRGMILPLVLVGMLLVMTLSASLQQAAWRALRGAQAQWDGQRGLYAAESAVVQAIAAWSSDAAAATPVGVRVVTSAALPDGWRTRTSIVRTASLTAVVHAVARREHIGVAAAGHVADASRLRRTVLRVLRLEPPALPILAAATLLGDVTMGTATLDGRDQVAPYDPARDDCGPWRDTASLAGLAVARPPIRDTLAWRAPVRVLDSLRLMQSRAQIDSAFVLLRARATTGSLTADGALPTTAAWRATVIAAPGGVTLREASTHVGLLVIDADLVLRSTLRVDGLLVVRGAIDASAGALVVRGALLVGDVGVRGSHFGNSAQVMYAPCLMSRALAAVASPRAAVYGAWNSP